MHCASFETPLRVVLRMSEVFNGIETVLIRGGECSEQSKDALHGSSRMRVRRMRWN